MEENKNNELSMDSLEQVAGGGPSHGGFATWEEAHKAAEQEARNFFNHIKKKKKSPCSSK